MHAILALVRKNVLVTVRAPLIAVIAVLVPVAFATLYAVVIRVSTTAPVAVALEDRSAEAAALVEVMRTAANDDGLLYEIRTTDPVRARDLYEAGDVGALVTVPAGFGERVRAGEPVEVRLDVVTVNADGVKNQQLRLAHVVREFEQRRDPAAARLRIAETTVLEHDVPVTVYLGSALLVLAALYAGIINAGTAVTREWEDRTVKELVLAPSGIAHLLAGTWLSAAVVSAATVVAAGLGIAWVLQYPIASVGAVSVGILALVWAYGAAIGSLLGAVLRRSLPLVPVGVIVAIGHFLVYGYESYVRGFAHGGVVEALWRATAWFPFGGLVDAFRFEVAGLPGAATGLGAAVGWSATLAVALTLAAGALLRRSVVTGQGQ